MSRSGETTKLLCQCIEYITLRTQGQLPHVKCYDCGHSRSDPDYGMGIFGYAVTWREAQ
jgi:hypothetical protein